VRLSIELTDDSAKPEAKLRLPRCRIGPDGFYGSTDWAGDLTGAR
jgi:hypothetical protein